MMTPQQAAADPSAAILHLLTERESIIVHGAYIGHVLALQCRGLIRSEREGDKLRVRRKENE